MSDETKKLERFSIEWHIRRQEGTAEAERRLLAGGLMPHKDLMIATIDEADDLAQKLRQAARDAAEVERLEEYALNQGCERCADCGIVLQLDDLFPAVDLVENPCFVCEDCHPEAPDAE